MQSINSNVRSGSGSITSGSSNPPVQVFAISGTTGTEYTSSTFSGSSSDSVQDSTVSSSTEIAQSSLTIS